MSNISVSKDSAPPREPTSRPGDRIDGPPWRAADFQAALHRASREPVRQDDKDDDDPTAAPTEIPTGPLSALSREPTTFKADTEEAGKVDIVVGQGERNLAAPAVEPAVVMPGSPVDLQSFAQMLDKVWVGDFANGAKAMQVRFLDQSLPMSAMQMVRLPDGAMSVTLAASGQAVPQVSKTLETLRRRLEARGLDVVDLRVEADKGDDPQQPYVVGRAG